MGASNPTTIGSGATGISAGKVSISSFNVMKKTEAASAKVFSACATGKHIDTAEITMRKASGDGGQLPFLKYKFYGVMVESIQWSGSAGGDERPTESISLAFSKVEIEYLAQDTKTGKTSVAGQASWDISKVTT